MLCLCIPFHPFEELYQVMAVMGLSYRAKLEYEMDTCANWGPQ